MRNIGKSFFQRTVYGLVNIYFVWYYVGRCSSKDANVVGTDGIFKRGRVSRLTVAVFCVV